MSDLTDATAGASAGAGPNGRVAADWGEPRSKTIVWYDQGVALAQARELSGLAYVQAIADGTLPPPPIAGVIGIRLVAVHSGEITLACTPDESLLNTIGLVHGGVLCTLMDTAMGIAVQSTLGPGVASASIELKVSFLKPLPCDGREVSVIGRTLRTGRRVCFAEAECYSPDGALIGHGTSSLATLGA
jgi:uncharacterized protein (TIGR00369 family)